MDQIPADQKRALGDFRCAARKLAKLYEEHGLQMEAAQMLEQAEKAQKIVENIRRLRGGQ